MATSRPTALVCDDDPAIRQLVRLICEDTGLDLVGDAALAYDAVDQARELQPDVIILDLALTGTSGMEVIPELRAACPEGRIVVFSAYADPSSPALQKDVFKVIRKTDVADLESTLKLLAVRAGLDGPAQDGV